MACEKIKRPVAQICIGDLDEEIVIMSRTKAAYNTTGIPPKIDTAGVYTVWAAHDPYKGYRNFDSSNGPNQPQITDKFIIRNIDEIDVTYVIESRGIIYQIVGIEQMRKQLFMNIYAYRKGDENVAINFI